MAAVSETIFQVHFCEQNILYFDLNFTEVCSLVGDELTKIRTWVQEQV